MKDLAIVLIALFFVFEVHAQTEILSFIDVGKNNASDGTFIKNTIRSKYQLNTYSFEAGIQFDLRSANPNTLSGLDGMVSKEFQIKNSPLEMKGFLMLNRFSDLLYETNWGATIKTKKYKNFTFELGTNFKTYTINSSASKKHNIEKSNRKLHENFNLIYTATAYLKPQTNDWNMGLSFTNIDYYIINQPSNPVFNLQTKYKVKSNLSLYLDAWYKQAGVFNINANYFGYFLRGGIKWEI